MTLNLHAIEPEPSAVVRGACDRLDVARQTVQSVLDLYARKGFVPPWIDYLVEEDGVVVGSCGFTGPPVGGEAEIAYFTFPGHEGRGVAGRMAAALVEGHGRASAADVVLIAHTLPQAGPSTRILERLGFSRLGVLEHPEDGPVWKWRRAPMAVDGSPPAGCAQ